MFTVGTVQIKPIRRSGNFGAIKVCTVGITKYPQKQLGGLCLSSSTCTRHETFSLSHTWNIVDHSLQWSSWLKPSILFGVIFYPQLWPLSFTERNWSVAISITLNFAIQCISNGDRLFRDRYENNSPAALRGRPKTKALETAHTNGRTSSGESTEDFEVFCCVAA